MARYKGAGTKGARPAYKSDETPRVVSQGSVSKPQALPRPRPKAPRTDAIRRVKAPAQSF